MKTDNKGFVVPVAIAVLVAASIGLLSFSWLGGVKKEQVAPNKMRPTATSQNTVQSNKPTMNTANDDKTLDGDMASIEAGLKGLDDANADINSSFSDSPASL